ncbi:hypothetical protein GIB67_038574 [Kingdonia uniflora]|uniref:Strictosidine synthase conserved region domain-containing protein n=1 Tax=Kingdonia uniflora TaxID=39325 RepID=A0A7J7NPD7_9MAGN|nr:hypothetical protein GIB67_038574 [Kingdonia uniflora]
METRKSLLTVSFFLFFSSLMLLSNAYQFDAVQLTSHAVGPESLAFDCNGEGPYTGLSDGRIFKWGGLQHGWSEFAVTSQDRRDMCDGSNDPELEHICGRPLGLQFNKVTGDLYIADAYFGLFVVGQQGGVATLLASSAEGLPFMFTNGVDIDTDNGVVYFTDSSIWFHRREYMLTILSSDSTGRFMKYDIQNKEVTVLLRDLQFANGVTLSKDNSYVLIAETTTRRILRYWLKGSKANSVEIFANLPANPDNIKRNSIGEFWVALNNGRGSLGKLDNVTSQFIFMDNVVSVRIDEEGNILEVVKGDGPNGGSDLEPVSEVLENNGKLWIGSVEKPYISLSKT